MATVKLHPPSDSDVVTCKMGKSGKNHGDLGSPTLHSVFHSFKDEGDGCPKASKSFGGLNRTTKSSHLVPKRDVPPIVDIEGFSHQNIVVPRVSQPCSTPLETAAGFGDRHDKAGGREQTTPGSHQSEAQEIKQVSEPGPRP